MPYFVLLTLVNSCIASALIDMHDRYIQRYFPTIMAKFAMLWLQPLRLSDVIDDDEFFLLYDACTSRNLTYTL